MKRRFALGLFAAWFAFYGFAFEKGNPLEPGGALVLVVDYGFHTGIVFQRQDMAAQDSPHIRALLVQFPAAQWFEFGWGDAGFYQGAATIWDVEWGMAARAMLWPSESVMHVVTGRAPVRQVFARLDPLELRLTPTAIAAMLNKVDSGFARMVPISASPNGVFYPGQGSYHLFQTCNNWAGQVLRAGGLGASKAFATTSWGLMLELRLRYGV